MFEKNMRLSYLLDFYGEVLDEKTRRIMSYYYEDDLSLAEIASGEGISRQGIRHIIKKSEELILFYEEKLGLARKHEELEGAAELLSSLKSEILASDMDTRESIASKLDGAIGTILSKGV